MDRAISKPGAIAFLIAVFLNAFVDLGHKIVIQNTVFKMYDGAEQIVLTAVLNGLILLPFIMLFIPAGHASDRFPKTRVMRATAWAAVILTVGITLSYQLGLFWVAFAMTFLLAVQSAFYSPAKLGYIKAYFGSERLAEMNGVVQAASIVAILAGTLLFSILFELWYPDGAQSKSTVLQAIVPAGFLLVANNVIQLLMVYRLHNPEPPSKVAPFDYRGFLGGRLFAQNLAPVWANRSLRNAIAGLAVFWSIGQVMLAAFPAFAKAQTGTTNTIVIQAIVASAGIGIAVGAWLAGRVSRGYIETGILPLGAAGFSFLLLLMPTLDSLPLMGLSFLCIGIAGGLFIVPLNALVQFHASEEKLGQTLAANNLAQNIAMISFLMLTALSALAGVSGQSLLLAIGVFAIAGGSLTAWRIPQSLIRVLSVAVVRRRHAVAVEGIRNIPQQGSVLLHGEYCSPDDWLLLQIACPRPIRFFMQRDARYPAWFSRRLGVHETAGGSIDDVPLDEVTDLLDQGCVVCILPASPTPPSWEDHIDSRLCYSLKPSHSDRTGSSQQAASTGRTLVQFHARSSAGTV